MFGASEPCRIELERRASSEPPTPRAGHQCYFGATSTNRASEARGRSALDGVPDSKHPPRLLIWVRTSVCAGTPTHCNPLFDFSNEQRQFGPGLLGAWRDSVSCQATARRRRLDLYPLILSNAEAMRFVRRPTAGSLDGGATDRPRASVRFATVSNRAPVSRPRPQTTVSQRRIMLVPSFIRRENQ